jgi:DNA invertase Pin-like site-specific DNA recombinase
MKKAKKSGEKRGVVGYLRVSTEEQADSGAGLAVQEAAIRAECQRRELPLLALHTDAGVSGKSLVRPALTAALEDLDARHGDVLMVAKLDRLTRSVHDASGLMQRSEKSGWGLVALDAPVDTTTPAGRAMAQILSVFAELERRLIGERTKAALAVKKSQGVVLGRPRTLPDKVVQRIVRERAKGRTWMAIADGLNADRVATAQGGLRWYPATVRSVSMSAERRPSCRIEEAE